MTDKKRMTTLTPVSQNHFPSIEDRNRLRRSILDQTKGYKSLSEEDTWRWHSYDYGWRRVYLNAREERSPIDPDGQWINLELITQAEEMFCRTFAKKPPPQEIVRDDFERLPPRDWTDAEIALKRREMDDLCRERGLPIGEEGWAQLARDGALAPMAGDDAAEYRERWAKDHGFASFAHAKQFGLVAASRMKSQQQSQAPAGPPAKEILPP